MTKRIQNVLTILYTNDPCPRWWAVDPVSGRRTDLGFWSHPSDVTRGLATDRAYLLTGTVSPGERQHYVEFGERPERMLFVSDVDMVRVCPVDVLMEDMEKLTASKEK